MSFIAIGLGLSVAGSAVGAISANKAKKKAERKEARAVEERNKLKKKYGALDTTNPYLDMENTMEDLTINQRQYDLQKQQFEQSQANILGGLRQAAGGSGIASVAQALSQQSQLASQQSASIIGEQERQNQMAERQMAANLQDKERQGEIMSRNWERDKTATLLGMSQQEVAAYREQAAFAQQAKMDAIAGGISAVGNAMTGVYASGGCPECEADFGSESSFEINDPSLTNVQSESYEGPPANPCPGLE